MTILIGKGERRMRAGKQTNYRVYTTKENKDYFEPNLPQKRRSLVKEQVASNRIGALTVLSN